MPGIFRQQAFLLQLSDRLAGALRQRWGLPDDYPMAAPAYAAIRSKMAKDLGFGRKRAAPTLEPEPAAAPEPVPVAPQPARRVFMRKRAKVAE